MSEKTTRLLKVEGWCIAVRKSWRVEGEWQLWASHFGTTKPEAIASFCEIFSRGHWTRERSAGVARCVRVKITAEVPE